MSASDHAADWHRRQLRPVSRDLVTQSDTDALVSAVCSLCLPARLRDWYRSGNGVRPEYRDNLVVLPHDRLRWEDEDAEDGVIDAATLPI